MLAQARARGLYDALACAELTAFLAGAGPAYDLIVAADVLVYFGPLARLFAAAAAAVRPGGWLACSVEAADGPGVVLQSCGRYAHSDAAVLGAAGDWTLRHRADAVLRQDRGQPVAGRVYVFQRC
jgi:predicted TPR repeat methyltransferase